MPRRTSALLSLLLLVPAPSIGVLFGMFWFEGQPLGQAVWAATKVWLVALPIVWWVLVDRRRPSWSPMHRGGVAAGMITGLAICVVIIAAYALLGRRLIDVEQARAQLQSVGLGSMLRYLLMCAFWVFVNSVIEEYVWRWFVYVKLRDLAGGAAAVVLSAAAFTLHHVFALGANFHWQPLVVAAGSLGVFVGGVTWSALYHRYGSVWPGWISHAWADVGVFAVGWWILFG